MLRELPIHHDPRVLAGHDMADDAGIFRLTDGLALIQTIDFFTPVVDDPFTYGQIAATNALSDVYSMGGTPLTALNVTVYPTKTLPLRILSDIMRGGASKAAEADVTIIGGHTVDGEEPMYGLSVTGVIDPNRIVHPSGGRAGDVLVLTKPLGTGVIATALKAGQASKEHLDGAVWWMTRLNRSASSAMLSAGAHASTDVTGFGFLGHLSEMARASDLSAEIDAAAVPVMPGSLEYAERGFVPAGGRTNREYLKESAQFEADIPDSLQVLLCDPQTSGGILMAVPPDRLDVLRERLVESGDEAAIVGHLQEGPAGYVRIK